MKETKYLSDEELFLLIGEIEDSGALNLPGDLKEAVLDAVTIPEEASEAGIIEKDPSKEPKGVERPPKILELRRKYRRSCIQISFAAAACALFLVFISGTERPPTENRTSLLASVMETRSLSEIGESRTVLKEIGSSRVITGKFYEITKEPEKGE